MDTIFLKKGEDRRLRAGHLWVFSNEVDTRRSALTAFAPGQPVQVADAVGRILGTAYINPASLIAARLVSRQADDPLTTDMLRQRLQVALALRERLFSRPFYRLCHSEGDYLPGLVVDRHDSVLVVQISTAGMDRLTPQVLEILRELLGTDCILLDNDIASRDLEGLPRSVEQPLHGVPDTLDIEENGLHYTISLKQGQKTGWFYDQRCNRQMVSPFASGASVLDAFCYVGGFGALAAHQGAAHITFVDSSASALELARTNALQASTESLVEAGVDILKGDGLELLAELRRQEKRFNVVCLDPPAFIKRRKDAAAGLEAYRRANELALDLVAPGGVLMTCSCSHHLEASALQTIVAKGAAKRKRPVRLLYRGFQGPDHPVHPSMPETAYLKAFLFQTLA